MSQINKKFLSEKEASNLYGFSVHWFRRKRWSGENGPQFIKMGHRVAYRPDDLEQYFNQFQACNSTSEYNQHKGGEDNA